MNINRVNQFNRQAPLNQAGQLVEMIPPNQLVVPNVNNLAVLLQKIRNKGLRDLFINIVIIITVIYSAYTFYQSDAYL